MSLQVALSHRFEGFTLDAAFEAPAGVTALFGRSGSGKTTIVNAVAGLLRPDRGRVAVGGEVLLDTEAGLCLPAHRRRVGYVFQDARLFPHMTVAQNLRYGARFAPAEPPGGLHRVVDLLGLEALTGRRPRALSGGEKQRVAIGRALLAAPRLLLLDEPLAALDEARKAEILPYLERLRDEAGLPILYVSHAVAEVARLANTIVAMDAGRVLRAGPAPEVLADPAALPALGSGEAGAVLRGRVARHHEDGLTEIAVSAGTVLVARRPEPEGTALRLRIHGDDVILARTRPDGLSALNVLPVRVVGIVDGAAPGSALVRLAAGEDRLLATVTRRSVAALGLAEGQSLFALLKTVAVAPGDVTAAPRHLGK